MLEAVFKFQSQQQISSILSNYNKENVEKQVNFNPQATQSDKEDSYESDSQQPLEWTLSEDMILIDNYPKFKDLTKK